MRADRPTLILTSVTIACPAPRELVEFYARLLDAVVTASEEPGEDEPPEAGWAQLSCGPMTVSFEYERCWTRPLWPAREGRQTATQHLDIQVEDLEAATAWAISCGAVLADVQPQEDVRVLLDPAGHPFCLFT